MSSKALRRPGRLPGISYVGMQRYSLTLCAFDHETRFTSHEIVDPARSHLLQLADDFRFGIPAYCFMPDHVHVLAIGETLDSDLEAFMAKMKQLTGFRFKKLHRASLWQDGYYDRILRDEQETIVVARYILANPVRAGLVVDFRDYPFSGSTRYTMDELADAMQSQG
jgi:putative transposase